MTRARQTGEVPPYGDGDPGCRGRVARALFRASTLGQLEKAQHGIALIRPHGGKRQQTRGRHAAVPALLHGDDDGIL